MRFGGPGRGPVVLVLQPHPLLPGGVESRLRLGERPPCRGGVVERSGSGVFEAAESRCDAVQRGGDRMFLVVGGRCRSSRTPACGEGVPQRVGGSGAARLEIGPAGALQRGSGLGGRGALRVGGGGGAGFREPGLKRLESLGGRCRHRRRFGDRQC